MDSGIGSAGPYDRDGVSEKNFQFVLYKLLDGGAIWLDLPAVVFGAVIRQGHFVVGHLRSSAAIGRSSGTVILRLRCDPGINFTLAFISSTNETSSVTVIQVQSPHPLVHQSSVD